jgi:hypothetical protein
MFVRAIKPKIIRILEILLRLMALVHGCQAYRWNCWG